MMYMIICKIEMYDVNYGFIVEWNMIWVEIYIWIRIYVNLWWFACGAL